MVTFGWVAFKSLMQQTLVILGPIIKTLVINKIYGNLQKTNKDVPCRHLQAGIRNKSGRPQKKETNIAHIQSSKDFFFSNHKTQMPLHLTMHFLKLVEIIYN